MKETLSSINYLELSEIAASSGDAFYILDENQLVSNYKELHSSFCKCYENFSIGYSFKTNYIPYLCNTLVSNGAYAEVVSEMEFDLAKKLNIPFDKIIYNGPYKSYKSIEEALLKGSIVNLDSYRDLEFLDKLAISNQTCIKACIRVNFSIGESDSRFGFDIEDLEVIQRINQSISNGYLSLLGIHCHFPDREIGSYKIRVEKLIKCVEIFFKDTAPEILNIGGGFFSDLPDLIRNKYKFPIPSFSDYAATIGTPLSDYFNKKFGKLPHLFIEPGTALVANTLHFFARIIDVKNVRTKKIVTVAGSIFNISPIARSLNLPVRIVLNEKNEFKNELFDIAGYTCIEGDYLSKDVTANLNKDGFVHYSNVGSYSIVMKPPFILPNVPILLKHNEDGSFIEIKKAEDFNYIFNNFFLK